MSLTWQTYLYNPEELARLIVSFAYNPNDPKFAALNRPLPKESMGSCYRSCALALRDLNDLAGVELCIVAVNGRMAIHGYVLRRAGSRTEVVVDTFEPVHSNYVGDMGKHYISTELRAKDPASAFIHRFPVARLRKEIMVSRPSSKSCDDESQFRIKSNQVLDEIESFVSQLCGTNYNRRTNTTKHLFNCTFTLEFVPDKHGNIDERIGSMLRKSWARLDEFRDLKPCPGFEFTLNIMFRADTAMLSSMLYIFGRGWAKNEQRNYAHVTSRFDVPSRALCYQVHFKL